jgi:hypothetical protein
LLLPGYFLAFKPTGRSLVDYRGDQHSEFVLACLPKSGHGRGIMLRLGAARASTE